MHANEPPTTATATPGPDVRPGDAMALAAWKVARHHLQRMDRHAGAIRGGSIDPEAVHDMRVATRRVRAVLGVFRKYLPGKPTRALQRSLRGATRRLGRVRDLDVLLADLAGSTSTPPMDTGAIEHFRTLQQEALGRLERYLEGPRHESLVRRAVAFLAATADAAAMATSGKVALAAPVLVFEALAEARATPPGRKPGLDELHRLRIRLKHLRYTVECFQEVLGDPGSTCLAELRDLQDTLGAIQDSRVAADRVEGYLRDAALPGEARAALAAYARRRRREAASGARAFPARWEAFEGSGSRERLAAAAAAL